MSTDKKLRPFIWQRVIIDREGVHGKNEVAHPDLNKINPDWKGKQVIWLDIKEYDRITLQLVEELFTAKAEKQKDEQVEDKKVGKKTFFQGDKANNLFIVITRLPPAETFIDAVDRLNERTISIDNLQALDNAWPVDEYDQLIAEANLNKNATWDKAESYFIALGRKPKFQFRVKVWMFKMNFEKNVNDLITW